jgi:hypothetical protein
VPKGPKEIIVKLNAAVRAALADATVCKRFSDQGQDIPSPERQTPEALAAQQSTTFYRLTSVIGSLSTSGTTCFIQSTYEDIRV